MIIQQIGLKKKRQIEASYSRAQFYESYKNDIIEIFSKKNNSLSELNIRLIKKISKILEIETIFFNSKDFHIEGIKEEKLIKICQTIGADAYLSGPAAKNYIENEKFTSAKIELHYKDYTGYPEYQQLWGNFESAVSIIDVIFNCGEKSRDYIWGWRNGD